MSPSSFFIIAKAGKLRVQVSGLDAAAAPKCIGFLAGEPQVPGDFNTMGSDTMGSDETATLFGTTDAQLARSVRPIRKL